MKEILPPIIILAGGLATRMHPTTLTIPKSMIEINGKPFIYYQIQLLKKQDITHVVLCLGYLGEQIQGYLEKNNNFGLKIDYSYDGKQLLGTGGAVKQALKFIDNNCFFIIYGDSYLNINFQEVYDSYQKNCNNGYLLTIFKNSNKWDKSNIEYNKGKIIEYNKFNPTLRMHYIDYGLSIFLKKTFIEYDKKAFDLAELYHKASIDGFLNGYVVENIFYEIGSKEGLKNFENYIMSKEV
jgi:NDP-sugar pyrophosphorylase family protein